MPLRAVPCALAARVGAGASRARDGGIGMSGLAPDGRMSVPWPSPIATKSRLPNQITYPAGSRSEVPMGNGLDLLAILGDQMGTKREMSRSGRYLARQLSVP